ncbi:hypothetical protein PG996_012431 [Apiospora saccharicola]|uniref:Uncharacterized protein n=1 Tax=Apiospora saccharicola TaxID=335842 RepID=A0ABR1U2J7_9PEZI
MGKGFLSELIADIGFERHGVVNVDKFVELDKDPLLDEGVGVGILRGMNLTNDLDASASNSLIHAGASKQRGKLLQSGQSSEALDPALIQSIDIYVAVEVPA